MNSKHINKLAAKNKVIHQFPSGDTLSLNIFTIKGNGPGEHIHFQANVHGAELQGNAVIHHLMNVFLTHPFNGSVTFIPMANPLGLTQKAGSYTQGRFSASSGINFNRSYLDLCSKELAAPLKFNLEQFILAHKDKSAPQLRASFKIELERAMGEYERLNLPYGLSYEKKLALTLQKIAAKADYIFDLHTGPSACDYLYCAEFQEKLAPDLNFPYILIIPNAFAGALDEACFTPWVQLNKGLQGKNLAAQNIEAYTIELGSEEEINLERAKNQGDKILHLLQKRGVFQKPLPLANISKKIPAQYSSYLKNYKTYYAQSAGIIEYIKRPGEHIKAGDIMAKVLTFNPFKDSPRPQNILQEIVAHADGILLNHYPSGNIALGGELFQVMEKVRKLL